MGSEILTNRMLEGLKIMGYLRVQPVKDSSTDPRYVFHSHWHIAGEVRGNLWHWTMSIISINCGKGMFSITVLCSKVHPKLTRRARILIVCTSLYLHGWIFAISNKNQNMSNKNRKLGHFKDISKMCFLNSWAAVHWMTLQVPRLVSKKTEVPGRKEGIGVDCKRFQYGSYVIFHSQVDFNIMWLQYLMWCTLHYSHKDWYGSDFFCNLCKETGKAYNSLWRKQEETLHSAMQIANKNM